LRAPPPAPSSTLFPYTTLFRSAGEIFRQADLAATLRKLVEAETKARAAGKDRKAAIYAAYDRFYKGDIAHDLVRAVRDLGGNEVDRKSTRLNSSHRTISYAVFC